MKQVIIFIFLSCSLSTSLSSQCYPDRHSTNAHDGWVSCSVAPSPNPLWANGHWILYDLGRERQLYKSMIWNLNNPDELDWNIKSARFDYSVDGSSYTHLTTMTLSQAPGDPLYEGFEGPDFGGTIVRYVLITALSNYGGSCHGLGEIRFYTEPSQSDSLLLPINPCVNDGVLYQLDGGIKYDGYYSGPGVVSSYDDYFDFDPDAAGPGSHVISYTYRRGHSFVTKETTIVVKDCNTPSCLPCPPCSEDTVYDDDPLLSGVFFGKPALVSSGTVDVASHVNYRGTEAVILEPHFEVKNNAIFQAEIRDCSADVNLITNGDFESGQVIPWLMEIHDVAAASLSLDSSNPHQGNYSARVEVTNVSGIGWHIQLEQFGMSVRAGQTYILEFAARSSEPRYIPINVSRHNSPWTSYQVTDVNLSNQWETYSIEFTAPETNTGLVRVAANLGHQNPTIYWFDSFTLRPKT